jgi:hypothetical protein
MINALPHAKRQITQSGLGLRHAPFCATLLDVAPPNVYIVAYIAKVEPKSSNPKTSLEGHDETATAK